MSESVTQVIEGIVNYVNYFLGEEKIECLFIVIVVLNKCKIELKSNQHGKQI